MPTNKTQHRSPYCTLKQVASFLQVSQRTVRRWTENGDLPFYRLGGLIRIREDELQAFLHRRREDGQW